MELAGDIEVNRSANPLTWRRIEPRSLIIGLCVAAVASRAFLLWQRFPTPESAAGQAQFKMQNHVSTYTDSETAGLLGNSVQFAGGTKVLAFLIVPAAFRAMGRSFDKSAMMNGASIWQAATRIALKLTWSAIFATLLRLFMRATHRPSLSSTNWTRSRSSAVRAERTPPPGWSPSCCR